jgi:hypothetical protein
VDFNGEQRDTPLGTVARGVASAPLSFAWLFVLFVTTRIQRWHSTNLRRLRTRRRGR